MGMRANPTLALVVTSHENERAMIGVLLENSDYQVREVGGFQAALEVLACAGLDVGLCVAEFAGPETDECAQFARTLSVDYPWVRMIISAPDLDLGQLPGTARIRYPLLPLDVIIQAERVRLAQKLAILGSH